MEIIPVCYFHVAGFVPFTDRYADAGTEVQTAQQ